MTIERLTRDEVSIHVDAPPRRVYDIVTDITHMGEFSPETSRARWVGGARGPAVGARFRAWNRKGVAVWTNRPTVVVAEPGRAFAFSRRTTGAGEVVWRYDIQPDGDGTKLTESYDAVQDASGLVIWMMLRLMGVRDRKGDLRSAMTKTLARIKATVEGAA